MLPQTALSAVAISTWWMAQPTAEDAQTRPSAPPPRRRAARSRCPRCRAHRDRLTGPARKKDFLVHLLGDTPAHRRLIVLPAWNEEAAIGGCLDEIIDVLPEWDVVVVSDGSTDHTSVVARSKGVAVIDLPFNLGVGGARRAGFSYAIREGYTEVLQIDADGQHDPAEVQHLVDVMVETQADVVIGARFAGRGDYTVTGPRKWAMKLLSAVLSRVCGTRLTDTTSGLKLCGPRANDLYARDYPAEYLGDTVEAIVIAARNGLVVRQAGVVMRERSGGVPSHSPVKAAVFLVRAMMSLAIALTRPARVLEQEAS